jgi:hypothetical protein
MNVVRAAQNTNCDPIGFARTEKLPAPKTGGLYKIDG